MFKRLFGSAESERGISISLSLNQPETNEKYRLPYFFPEAVIFLSNDVISGVISVVSKDNLPINYELLNISIIGQYRVKSDDSLYTFFKRSRNVSTNAEICIGKKIEFQMKPVSFSLPSFYGSFVDVRYVIQVSMTTKESEYNSSVPIYVLFLTPKPQSIVPMKAEIGIKNVLHIEFVFPKPEFDCNSVLIGKLFFLIVKIRIVQVYLQIKREEFFDNGIVRFKNEAIVSQFELLDGVPVRGDSIPVRVFFPGIKVWPCAQKTKDFEVSYSVRFILFDENGKHYYKDLTSELFRYEL